jgi:Domain of unknown function (DUF6089)
MKHFFSALLLVFVLSNLGAQAFRETKITEVGISLNLLNYSGDLAQDRIVFKEGEFGFGVQIRQQIAKPINLLLAGTFGRISGDDANNSSDLQARKYRFFSTIREYSVQVEYLPLAKPYEVGSTGAKVSPYVFVGVGATFVDPKTEFYGTGPNPFPEKELKKVFICTPIGFGLRADVYEKVAVFGSVGWRPVYSDDLDGVSKNGNPNNPDWYTNFQLGFSYMIRGFEGDGFF